MNSNYGKSNPKSGSLNSFDFDLGLNKSGSRSLNDQKNQTSSYTGSYSSVPTKPSTTSSWGTQQTNKPSWTHQPVESLSGPTSMVGDIFGKSWGSSTPAGSMNSGIGVVKKDPNMFGDLLSSAMGQNKGNSNVPLKNAAPVSNKSSFSMGGMADSLPRTGTSVKTGGNWGSGENFGSYTSGFSGNNSGRGNVNFNGNASKGANLGGPSTKSMAGSGELGGMSSKKDPFGSLVDFSSKPSGSMNSGSKGSSKSSVGDDAFGSFQNASKTSGLNNNSMGSSAGGSYSNIDGFSSNQTQSQPSTFPSGNNNSMGSGAGGSYSNVNDFGFSNSQSQSQPSVQSTGVNDFDALFSSTTGSSSGTASGNAGFEGQQFSGGDDWGLDSEFGGGHDTGGTTELEGLPPPPAGVSAATAKNKGLDNYKQGQYADAIKWLSWAVILLEKSGDDSGSMEVLTCRASCYKEVGEYKKAVADCTKALEQDDKNVTILVQRALLYESMEKYKLGAEDLRTVMKIDPGNRVARSTIHRLTKMAE
ncbi:hypothetical protein ACH5RR_031067 [Cinchona calisaya]|uniref:Uncharacterized protein n=1 Tax=Cinchona calisaya TaxID=153742 RepID=A0ABD2YEA4_9GENT